MRSLFLLCLGAVAATSGEARTLRGSDSTNNSTALQGRNYNTYCFGEPEHSMGLVVLNEDEQTTTARNAMRTCNVTVNASVCPIDPKPIILCQYEESHLQIGGLVTPGTDSSLLKCIREETSGSKCEPGWEEWGVPLIAVGLTVLGAAAILGARNASSIVRCCLDAARGPMGLFGDRDPLAAAALFIPQDNVEAGQEDDDAQAEQGDDAQADQQDNAGVQLVTYPR